MNLIAPLIALLLALASPVGAAVPTDATIATYHGDPARSGNYIVPGLTWAAVAKVHRDSGFDGRVEGHVYAQPLYWRPPGAARGLIIVATESDVVDALDADTGRLVWHTSLGTPVPRSALPCGDIDPSGITGTPVIDPASGSLFLDAMTEQKGTPEHLVFGLRLSDGTVLPGWPINAREALRTRGIAFVPRAQDQRAALALLGERVLIGFGGNFGDCGDYRGTVLGLPETPPGPADGWATRGAKGGIWAPGGLSTADGSVFFATGNTETGRQWGDGEGVFRLPPSLTRATDPRDYYAPANWKRLDEGDLDMSGVSPLPIDLPSGTNGAGTNGAGAHRLVALGKDGNAYLLNRDDLGGIGGQIAITQAAGSSIITGPAVYTTGGRTFVAFQAAAAVCPGGVPGGGLGALEITASAIAPAWCAPLDGRGAPIVTTTDGHSEPIVWAAGAEGDNRLHGYRGDTGEAIYTSPDRIAGLRHFVTILPAAGRLYIAGDGRVTAWTVP